jgi:chromatin segregation and condensation protein Rec8/ScpA/Scc1 (kleisin family)
VLTSWKVVKGQDPKHITHFIEEEQHDPFMMDMFDVYADMMSKLVTNRDQVAVIDFKKDLRQFSKCLWLSKLGLIELSQNESFGTIEIRSAEDGMMSNIKTL